MPYARACEGKQLGNRVMAVRVAINGFGRIGRLVLRSIIEANRATSRSWRSTTWGRWRPMPICFATIPCTAVSRRGNGRWRPHHADGQEVDRHQQSREPPPQKELGVDIALECTGIFTSREKAQAHLTAGAKRVLISAPPRRGSHRGFGVNHDKLTREHIVVSNASCTTNCLAPVAKVLQ